MASPVELAIGFLSSCYGVACTRARVCVCVCVWVWVRVWMWVSLLGYGLFRQD